MEMGSDIEGARVRIEESQEVSEKSSRREIIRGHELTERQ
jgi:hypothetical protein